MKQRVGLILLTTMVLGGMLLSGVVLAKTLTGGPGSNNYTGGNGTDTISGGGGSDDLGGNGGADWLYGDGGNDRLHGGRGHDRVDGGPGTDTAWGDKGNDKLKAAETKYKGSYQAAKVKGGRKPDKLLGSRGNDTIRAKNGKKDIIRGGPGYDKAYVDRVDDVKGVEKKFVRGGGGGGGGTGGGNPQPNPNPVAPQKKQCEDGKDNDHDGKTDFGPGANNDPGCAKATDNTENAPPVANDDTLTTDEDDPEGENVIFDNYSGEDTDVDGDNLSVSNFKQPRHGEVTRSTTNPSEILTYRPTHNYNGPDSFNYTVSDGHGGKDTGTVKVTVSPRPEQCEDGDDNDGDGMIDFGTGPNNDPGCTKATDESEDPNPPMGQ